MQHTPFPPKKSFLLPSLSLSPSPSIARSFHPSLAMPAHSKIAQPTVENDESSPSRTESRRSRSLSPPPDRKRRPVHFEDDPDDPDAIRPSAYTPHSAHNSRPAGAVPRSSHQSRTLKTLEKRRSSHSLYASSDDHSTDTIELATLRVENETMKRDLERIWGRFETLVCVVVSLYYVIPYSQSRQESTQRPS